MDLTQLKYFVQVAELGGFARAADLLEIPQPTLSRHIRALEVEIRSTLFHRHGRGVTLTPAGARFLFRAKGLLHSADLALTELHDGDAALRGRVVCGLTPSVGRVMIPDFVRRFREELPFAELAILNQLSGQLHDQLRASRIDFAILHNPPPSPTLQVELLASQALYLVGRRQIGPDRDSVSVKHFAGLSLIMPSAPHVTREPLQVAAAKLQVPLKISVELDAIDSLFELVNAGFAHTVSTKIAISSDWAAPDLIVQKIVEPDLATDLYLASPLKQNMTRLQEAALAQAKRAFSAALASIGQQPSRSISE